MRPTNDILSTHFNTLSKLNCILASIEANKLGYDEEIMNDCFGNVSTCAIQQIFFILKGEVFTSSENIV